MEVKQKQDDPNEENLPPVLQNIQGLSRLINNKPLQVSERKRILETVHKLHLKLIKNDSIQSRFRAPLAPKRKLPICYVTRLKSDEKKLCNFCCKMVLPKYQVRFWSAWYLFCDLKCLHQAFRVSPVSLIDFPLVELSICICCHNQQREFDDYITWQTLPFCSMKCVFTFRQVLMDAGCSHCKKAVNNVTSEEQFVRVGPKIQLYCSKTCLKVVANPCKFCHSLDMKGKTEFCSELCRLKHAKAINPKSLTATCIRCNKETSDYVEMNTNDSYEPRCDQLCFMMATITRQLDLTLCHVCKVYYPTKDITKYRMTFDQITYNYCSVGCRNVMINLKNKIVHCIWCLRIFGSAKMFSKFAGFEMAYFCSLCCMSQFLDATCSTCSQRTTTFFHLELPDYQNKHFCTNKCMQRFLSLHLTSFKDETVLKDNSKTPEAGTSRVLLPLTLKPIMKLNNVGTICTTKVPPKATNAKILINIIPGKKKSLPSSSNAANNQPIIAAEQTLIKPETKNENESMNKDSTEASKKVVATSKDPSWAFNATLGMKAWYIWRKDFRKRHEKRIIFELDILKLTPAELMDALVAFLDYTRKPDGLMYQPDTYLYLILGIREHLYKNKPGEDILNYELYTKFTTYFNNILRIKPPDEQIVKTRIIEDFFWDMNILGTSNPMSLLRTMVYFNTKYFNLQTLEDHLNLAYSNIIQLEVEKEQALRYFPEKQPKLPKIKFYEIRTIKNSARCPVRIYKVYQEKCSTVVKTQPYFYLRPQESGLDDKIFWFSNQPITREELEFIINLFRYTKEILVAKNTFKRDF